MFCPICGSEEINTNQFCRVCGADLSAARFALAKTDQVTASAISAREEIGRAVAAQVRELDSANDLKKFAEDVLPKIEKFLESPEEKRLRRMRTGTIISSVGLGATLAFKVMGILLGNSDIFFLAALGMITFFIGVSFIVNGMFFTLPKKNLSGKSDDAEGQRELDTNTPDLVLPESRDVFSTITEHTTHQLSKTQKTPLE